MSGRQTLPLRGGPSMQRNSCDDLTTGRKELGGVR